MSEKKLDCPFCAKEGHLYYNVTKGVFYCFKCHAKGHTHDLKRAGLNVVSGSRLLEEDVSYRMTEALETPPPFKEITTSSRRYLTGRKIHESVLLQLRNKIYDTDTGILFFFPDQDYWQVRRWTEFVPPRWKNPTVSTNTPATGIVYHLRNHHGSREVVIVEGIGDALRVAPFANVAAILSSRFHAAQAIRLTELGYDSARIIFDRDVPVTTRLTSISTAGCFFRYVSAVDCEAKDPGEATDERLKEICE